MPQENRRAFLRKTGAASALTLAAGQRVVRGAGDKVVLALIGCRNQGRHDAISAIQQGAEFKTICDLDDAILAKVGPQIQEAQGKAPGTAKDFRRVLDDKDVDAVIIATPDHWHALPTIQACQAGKDVYIEKPLSHTIHEGHLMRDAARKYKRIMQVGTQRRSGEHFRSAVEYVASGKLGKVCLVKAWITQVRKSIGRPPDGEPPAGADYDMWLGPAPKRAFNPNRFHYNWRFFWDYGNTELGNQGVHMLDIAMWGIARLRGGLEGCLPKRISSQGGIYWLDDAKEVPDTQVAAYDFGDLLLVWEMHSFQDNHPLDGSDAGTGFFGTEGTLVVEDGWKVYGPKNEVVASAKDTGGSHTGNFLECVKSRKTPNADVETGRMSTTICHLGNISHRLGRDLRFDPKTETFPGDKEANTMLTKEYRKPYVLPQV